MITGRTYEIILALARLGVRDFLPVARRILGSASFSQFGEDLVVDRALKLPVKGFYVDVGAHHPVWQSTTFRFYAKGWRGITIEPNAELFAKHRRVRPRDRALNVGVSARDGQMTYYEFTPSDFNTFDAAMVDAAIAKSARLATKRNVEVRRLDSILGAEMPPGVTIDLMSIDCEGLDLEVIDSNDWTRFKPAVLLVEDHAGPGSAIDARLKGLGYRTLGRVSYTSFYGL